METVHDVIEAAKKALNVESDNAFAQKLGITRGAVSNWKRGVSLPDTVTCATLAGLTGIPLARVLGIVGEARAISREEKAVWRKLAASVGIALIAVLATLPSVAHAANGASQVMQSAHPFLGEAVTTMHYAKYGAGAAGTGLALLLVPAAVGAGPALASQAAFPCRHKEPAPSVALLYSRDPLAALAALSAALGCHQLGPSVGQSFECLTTNADETKSLGFGATQRR